VACRAIDAAHRIRAAPAAAGAADWDAAIAWRYRKRANGCGVLEPVRHVGAMQLSDLQNIDVQKEKIARNTEQFVRAARPTTCC
jgi:predicted AAA+ superfamily ATPase